MSTYEDSVCDVYVSVTMNEIHVHIKIKEGYPYLWAVLEGAVHVETPQPGCQTLMQSKGEKD